MTLRRRILYLLILIGIVSCTDDNESVSEPNPPTIATGSSIEVENGSVILSASFESNGNEITKVGFEYSTSNTFIDNLIITDINIESDDKDFEYIITSDLEQITYFYRAFLESDSVIYGSTKSFTFSGYTPSINMLSPNNGQIGDTIMVLGDNFHNENSEIKIDFSGIEAQVIDFSDSIINLIIPDNIPSISNFVKVSSNGKISEGKPFTLNAPIISNITPDAGFDGSEVTLLGSNFSVQKDLNLISVNGLSASVLEGNSNRITFQIPQSEFVDEVIIKLEVGPQSAQTTFKLLGPTIENLSILEGYSGDTLIIIGKHLTQNGEMSKLSFGYYEATPIELTENKIITLVPSTTIWQAPESTFYQDYSIDLTYQNGLKFTYSQPFTIKKTWGIRTPATLSYGWMYKGFDHDSKGIILDKKLYYYDPTIDAWTAGQSYPGERDENNLFISHNNILYKLGGINHLGEVSSHWEYYFDSETWVQKGDLPFSFTNATHFIHDDKAFIVTNSGQVWSFNFETHVFTSRNNIPATSNGFGFAFNSGNEIYFITYGSTWKYNTQNDTWSMIASNELRKKKYSQHAIGFQINGTAFILENGEDLHRFLPEKYAFVKMSEYPGCRGDNSYKTTFTIGNTGFIVVTSGNYGGCHPLMYEFNYDR